MANLSGTPKYTLTITSDDTSVPNLVLSENDVTEFSGVRVTLTSLEITKQMYEPCKVEALIQFMAGEKANVNTMDSNMAIIDALSKLLGKKVELTDGVDDNPIAKDYVLCDFEPELRPGNGTTNLYVKLSIYSPEKLLTYNKGNSCHVAKKLGDVFKNFAKSVKITASSDNIQNIFKHEGNKSDKKSEADSKSTPGNGDDAQPVKVELIQPYMVQFDENPVEFLSRMANRCGEFLFYEDGIWQLGANASATSITINDYISLSFRKFTTQKQNVYSISNYANKEGYSEYGIEEDNNNETDKSDKQVTSNATEGTEKKEVVDKGEEENQNDKNEEENAESGTIDIQKIQYCGPSDEYLSPIKKKDSEGIGKTFTNPKYWIKNIPKWLKQDNLVKFVSKAALDTAETAAMAAIHQNDAANEYNETFYNGFNEESENQEKTVGYPLTSIFAKDQFSSKFYCQIEEKERESERLKIHVNLGSYYKSLRLGQVITIEGKGYLIVQITNILKVNEAHDNSFVSNLEIDALPIYDCTCYPCQIPGGTIRKTGPQLAKVTSVEDPLGIGRIQFKYPWQSDEEEGYSSPWIRISAACATDGGGLKFMPQEDDEIMVGYENGNIERPYMIGSLATTNTKSVKDDYILQSPNGQYIKFDNSAFTAEDLMGTFVPAYGTVTKFIPNGNGVYNALDSFNSKVISKYGGGIEIGDKLGFYKVSMSSTDRSIDISSTWGDVSINAFTGISINAPNGDIEIKGKNISIEAGNELTLRSGLNIYKKRVSKLMEIKKLKSIGTAAIANKVGEMIDMRLDLSMIRNIFECIFKPVGGTMLIKSSRFMRLEAGKKAKTALPPGVVSTDTDNRMTQIISYNTTLCAINAFDTMMASATTTAEQVELTKTAYNEELKLLLNIASSNLKGVLEFQYDGKQMDEPKSLLENPDLSFKKILEDCRSNKNYSIDNAMENINKIVLKKMNEPKDVDGFAQCKKKFIPILEPFIKYMHTIHDITMEQNGIEDLINSTDAQYQTASSYRKDENMKPGKIDDMHKLVIEVFNNKKADLAKAIKEGVDDNQLCILKRQIVYDVLKKLEEGEQVLIQNETGLLGWYNNLFNDKPRKTCELGESVCLDHDDWVKFLKCVTPYDEDQDNKKVGHRALNFLKDHADVQQFWDLHDEWNDNFSAAPEVKAEILMTDSSGNTVNINGTTINADANALLVKLKKQLKDI